MKGFFKFFFTSSALLILAGFASLYFGWIDFNYPNHYKGVVHFKTSGYSKTLLSPQTWYWNWQYIIPKNATIYAVDLGVQTDQLSLEGELPSSQALSSLVEEKEAFRYSLELDYSYILNEKHLIDLYKKHLLKDSDDLSPINKSLKNDLDKGLNRLLTQSFDNLDKIESLSAFKANIESELNKIVKTQFPFLKDFHPSLRITAFPELNLYKKANASLLAILKEKTEAKKEEEMKIAKETIEEQSRLEWLARYGELLKEYPELKDLLLSENLHLFSFFSQN